jgi:hypothetical protein
VRGAKTGAETHFGEDRRGFRPIDAVVRVAHAKWNRKRAVELALRADVTVRQAELWLSLRSSLSGDAFGALILSDIGFDILRELARGAAARPDWWKGFERQIRIADLRRHQAQTQRALEELERSA